MKYTDLKVLIVDDNPKNIQIIGNILLEEQVQIAYATEGSKALELAYTTNFDLILLDIMMPLMDGYEVCRKLRLQPSTAKTPIIFITAKTDSESIVKGFECGANDYLTKPFNSAELLARVKTHLDLFLKQKQLDELNRDLEKKVFERTKQLEAANRQLLSLEKAKSEFLSIISHELRSPLNALIGLTSLLDQTELSEEQKGYMQSLGQTSNRLARFSEMALLITSLQTKNQAVDFYEVLVKVLVEVAVEGLTFQIKEKRINIEQHIEDEHLLVFVDAYLIRKCISILIENAVYMLPEGGKVAIKAYRAKDKKVCIQVSDNGEGFSPYVLEVLNDFFLTGNMISNETVGLSLAAVKLIMDAHGGEITVDNMPEGGAKVCLFFERVK